MARPLIGPFRVLAPLASGGVADVYLAEHARLGTKVALKVLRESSRPYWEVLADEVRAAAALDHPNLVWLHDHGVVEASSDGFVEGAPWVAMELCASGSLRARSRSMGWQEVRDSLLQLLDGLAHAHGRGVLHRDVKAANVVFDEDRAVLTDFGLAYLQARHLAGEAEAPMQGGTPSYIAPEQLLGHWHEQGPWTDLYGLGAMAWTLVTGKAPYQGSRTQKLRGHLKGQLPPFRPRWPVPEAVEEWLAWLLARSPAHRPRSAAEARQALDEIGDPVPPRAPRGRRELGVGLCAVRRRRLAGRAAERERLLAALSDVRDRREGRVVVLEGAGGVGKATLARWLLEHVRREGLAAGLRASYDPGPGRRDGLAQALASLVRAPAAEHGTVLLRATEWLAARGRSEPLDALAIAHLVAPQEQVGVVPLDTPAARFALVRRVLARMGPTVLVLEQAHWGLEALRFARDLGDAPILVVLTFDPGLAGDAERGARRALEAETLTLQPLDPSEQLELVRGLGLGPELADRLKGRPLLAVETVRWWLQQDLLAPGPEGLEAKGELTSPGDLDTLWRLRCEAVIGQNEGWRPLLGVLAVLGVEVEQATWVRACAALGRRAPMGLLRSLAASGLATVEQSRVQLAHPTLRQALVRGSSETPRLHGAAARASVAPAVKGRHLLAAGELVEALEPLFLGSELARRRGEYDEAEQLVELHGRALRNQPAHDPRWGEAWVRRSTLCQVRKDVDGMEMWAHQALESAQIHTWMEVEGSARLKVSAALRLRGRLGEAWAEAKIAGSLADHLEDPGLIDRVIYEKIQVTARMGLLQDSLALAQRYLDNTLERPTRSGSVARAWLLVASANARLEEEEPTLHALAEARQAASETGERFILASCAVVRGELARKAGRPLEAVPHYEEAERTLDLLGHGDADIARLNLACCELDLGGRPEALARRLMGVEAGVLLAMGARVCLLPCVADRDDDETERLLEVLEASTVTDEDFARYAEMAAGRARDRARRDRLLAYARKQRGRLSR